MKQLITQEEWQSLSAESRHRINIAFMEEVKMKAEEIVISEETSQSLPTIIPKGGIVKPLVTPDEAVEAWKEYQQLKAKIIEASDIQKIQGRDFLKKSYWRKLEKFFGVSLECRSETSEDMEVAIRTLSEGGRKVIEYYPDGTAPEDYHLNDILLRTTRVFSARYRAIAPNGQYCEGDGYCDIWEKGYANSYHNARATAHTRAKNRAISDLVGGGEVSAEEITGEYRLEETSPKSPAPKKASPKPQTNKEFADELAGDDSQKPVSDHEIRLKMGTLILEMAAGGEKLAHNLTRLYSTFEKDGEVIVGKTNLEDLKSGWLASTYGKVKKAYEVWQTNKEAFWFETTPALKKIEELVK